MFNPWSLFYNYSLLEKQQINSCGPLKYYGYTGPIFKDKLCTKKVGTLLVDAQVVNPTTGYTKSSLNVNLEKGTISYLMFHKTKDGKGVTGQFTGPVICGTGDYSNYNTLRYEAIVVNLPNGDTRKVTFIKKGL